MMSRCLLLICAPILIIKIITVQCIPTPEVKAPSLLPDGIPKGLTTGSNVPINNIPIDPNTASLQIEPSMSGNVPLKNIGIGSNIALPVGSNLENNLGLGSNSPRAPGSRKLGSPAAMASSMEIAASNGGGFTVTSSSPIALTYLTDNSEYAIDGFFTAIGELPFLGSVSLEGVFPTAGSGAAYGDGDENIGMVNEGLSPSPMAQIFDQTFGQGSGFRGGQFW